MSEFTDQDLAQLEMHGIREAAARRQLELLRDPPVGLRLARPAVLGDGIVKLEPSEQDELVDAWRDAADAGRLSRFVPASGAATRMFRDLIAVRSNEADDEQVEAARHWFKHRERFAFHNELARIVMERTVNPRRDVVAWLRAMLDGDGLGYSDLPKGLIGFHRAPEGARTPFLEHLAEAAVLHRDAEGLCRLHFTVSAEHEELFRKHLEEHRAALEAFYDVRYQVTFSNQMSATDTLAIDDEGAPFRAGDGRLLLRPGGHGSLLHNLVHLDADLVFLKNIDNVVPKTKRDEVILWKKLLAGHLVRLEKRLTDLLRRAENLDETDAMWESHVLAFLEKDLGLSIDDAHLPSDPMQCRRALYDKLDRPLRICGMVRNEGEPGGGPFWVESSHGEVTLQIVEKAQINVDDPEQKAILEGSTHFNPVDLVCRLRDHRGRRYDLLDFADPDSVFTAQKSFQGRSLQALEHPGLWNGAMAHWNTVFVEVPTATFAPVKTIFDLLRPQHQPFDDDEPAPLPASPDPPPAPAVPSQPAPTPEPAPPVDLPETLNIADRFLDARVREGFGERIALRLPDGERTYREVRHLANRYGGVLRGLGVRQEERVMIALPDGEDFVGAIFGILKIGAVAVMVNPAFEADEIAALYAYCRPRCVVVHADFLDRFVEAASSSNWPEHLLVVGGESGIHPSFDALREKVGDELETVPTHRDDPAIWLFSGGTTGRPKAVVQTHRSFANTTELYGLRVLDYRPEDITLSIPKLYFGYATGSNLFFPFAVGGSAILFPDKPTPEVLFELIRRHRPTILINVPTLINRMVAHPTAASQDLSCLRFATSAGEALPISLYHRWKDLYGVELLDGLGTAEMWHVFLTNRLGDVKPGTLGRVVEGFEIDVRDAEGKSLPPGEVGKLWVRGESRAIGYWQNMDKTMDAFHGDWFVGGDMVRRDADGYVTYCGRGDDAMKVAGRWLLPSELESCLMEHDAVKECAVVGIEEEGTGLVKPYAFVLPTSPEEQDLEDILAAHALARLAPYKNPRKIIVLEDFPRTHLGKVDRGQLKQMA